MKIRIKGNSVRFRLTKSEVTSFCATGYHEELTEFELSTFRYSLRAVDASMRLAAEFKNDTITIYISKAQLGNWAENQEVGFYHDVLLQNGNTLSLTIEKDFVCLDETVEDQSDNFPNPNAPKN